MTSPVETHISSAIVHCRPEFMSNVIDQIDLLNKISVEAKDDRGKLVVLLETEHEHAIVDSLTSINNFEGVLSTHLVYHQVD